MRIVFNFSYRDSNRIYTGSDVKEEGNRYYYNDEFIAEEFFEIGKDGDQKYITLKNKLLVTCFNRRYGEGGTT